MFLYSVLLISPFLSGVLAICSNGWIRYGTSCYHISRDTATWAEAMKMCEIHNSVLASIETQAENDFLKTHLEAQRHIVSFWLGGSDWDNEGEWKWEPNGTLMTFTNWHKGQPDNSGLREHCLAVNRHVHFQFVDDNCQVVQHYVCEKQDGSSGGEELIG